MQLMMSPIVPTGTSTVAGYAFGDSVSACARNSAHTAAAVLRCAITA